MMRRYMMICLLLGLHCVVCGQTEYAYRYWLDQAVRAEYGGTVTDSIWTLDLDVDTLSEGFHQLHLQVKDTAGVWSAPQSRFFIKLVPDNADDLKLRYWFDDAKEVYEMAGGGGVHSIDVNHLEWGLHTVSYQVAGHNGIYSPATTAMFIKARMKGDTYTAQCYVGDSLYQEQTMTAEGGIVSWDLDVASLPRGLHPLRLQVNDSEGTILSVTQSFFWREHTDDEHGRERCLYTVDGGHTMKEATRVTAGGFQFEVDFASLKEGLHQLLCLIVSEEGEVLQSCSRAFMVNRPTTMRYDYWVNDDTTRMQTVMAEPMEPYAAIAMLDVPTYPLRSSSFHFAIEDSIPYIYAKNTLHARFYSSNGTYAEDSAQYADSGSRREVTGIQPLKSNKPHTDATPAKDSIRWYSIQTVADNQLNFCVSQPCTVQVFSPEGETVLEASGDSVTEIFSCQATTDGTYYVALHDVTGSDALTTISFQHGGVAFYKLYYMVDGELYDSKTVAYGDTIVSLGYPEKEAHTFSGWMGLPEVMPDSNVTVTGTFIANKYRVTYMVDDEVCHIDSVAYATTITPIPGPTKEGYTFSKWTGIPESMPAHDVTVTGEYTLNRTQTDAAGLIYELNEAGDAFEVIDHTEAMASDVVIPATLHGVPVTTIRKYVLMDTEGLRSIVIPASVTTVGEKAFYACNNLLVVEWNTTVPLRAECFDAPSHHGNMLVFVSDAATEVTYEGNVVVDGIADDLKLIGGMPFLTPREFTARSITYSHEFTKRTKIGEAGGWESMVLPFDVQRVVSETRGELKPFGEADFDTSLPYWLGELQTDGTFAAVQTITANKPFIMQLPNSDEYEDRYNVEGKVTFSAEEVTVHATVGAEQEQGEGYVLLGSYEGTESDNYIYALNDEEYTAGGDTYMPGGVFVAGSRAIRPFEAYIYSASANRAPYLRIGGCDTSVEDLVADKEDVWHTLQGIRLSGRPTERGIYIRNGKKVMVK